MLSLLRPFYHETEFIAIIYEYSETMTIFAFLFCPQFFIKFCAFPATAMLLSEPNDNGREQRIFQFQNYQPSLAADHYRVGLIFRVSLANDLHMGGGGRNLKF